VSIPQVISHDNDNIGFLRGGWECAGTKNEQPTNKTPIHFSDIFSHDLSGSFILVVPRHFLG
ncbi:uncharacterized protein METZ01_LOCUS433786, partial [marine metagenome]